MSTSTRCQKPLYCSTPVGFPPLCTHLYVCRNTLVCVCVYKPVQMWFSPCSGSLVTATSCLCGFVTLWKCGEDDVWSLQLCVLWVFGAALSVFVLPSDVDGWLQSHDIMIHVLKPLPPLAGCSLTTAVPSFSCVPLSEALAPCQPWIIEQNKSFWWSKKKPFGFYFYHLDTDTLLKTTSSESHGI